MALKDDVIAIAIACDSMLALIAFNAQTSFRVEGIDLNIPKALVPEALTNKLVNDFNAALTVVKTKAAGLPDSV